jgi:hypothetical protein
MSFMQRQITDQLAWYEIDTNNGTWFVPTADADGGKIGQVLRVKEYEELPDGEKQDISDTLLQYTEGTCIERVSLRLGHGARLSAPGYLDCTEWSVFPTVKEAEEYLDEYYPEDEDDDDETEA